MNILKIKKQALAVSIFMILVFVITPFFQAHADLKDDYESLYKIYENTTDSNEKIKKSVEIDMIRRQMAVEDSYENIKDRVDAMNKNDPRRDSAKDLTDSAEAKVKSFTTMNRGDNMSSEEPYRPKDEFNSREKAAINAINDINRQLLAPEKPGSVPEGDIVRDFIPWIIRTLFRFAFFAIFISFLVSGVMFITAFSTEERVTKAKNILYYSLIGFAFVSLAFAIVKAVTNIDFFGFI